MFSADCHHRGEKTPDDGKQPKTFGSNILIFNDFLTY